jgi:leucyl aminopeptidase
MSINFTSKLKKKTNLFIIFNNNDNLKNLMSRHINIDTKYNKIINEIEISLKKGKSEANLTLLDNDNYCQIYLFSYGNNKSLENARGIGYKICNISRLNKLKDINILEDQDYKILYSCLEGLMLSNYNFNKYKTKKYAADADISNNKKDILRKYTLNINILKNTSNKNNTKYQKILNLPHIVNAVFLARDLTSEPANILTPETFPKMIIDVIKKNKLDIKTTLYSTNQLKKMNMNLLVSVGKSNTNKSSSKLLVLEYNPNKDNEKANNNKQPFILLGKGVTFDTGGLNLKNTEESLQEAKTDMAGAATIISFLTGYAKINGNKHIICYIPIAENNLDSSSSKVGDIVKSHKGYNVEISDTDAEGRLMMADCLSLITSTYPKSKIINIATLTGQQESISCKLFSSIMGNNNETVVRKLKNIGNEINENLVSIPLPDYYLEKIKSETADIKNYSGNCSADMILAGIFLKQFINKNTNWTHIDIGGTAYHMEDVSKIFTGESSGIGVRLLFDFFE